jgi:hypothetical protein
MHKVSHWRFRPDAQHFSQDAGVVRHATLHEAVEPPLGFGLALCEALKGFLCDSRVVHEQLPQQDAKGVAGSRCRDCVVEEKEQGKAPCGRHKSRKTDREARRRRQSGSSGGGARRRKDTHSQQR